MLAYTEVRSERIVAVSREYWKIFQYALVSLLSSRVLDTVV